MFCLKAVISVALIGLIHAAEEPNEEQKETMKIMAECGEKWGVSENALEKVDHKSIEASEKILCFMKCTAEKDGMLDENGKLNEQYTDNIISKIKLEKQHKNTMKDCLGNLPLVKKCGDMNYIAKCFLNA